MSRRTGTQTYREGVEREGVGCPQEKPLEKGFCEYYGVRSGRAELSGSVHENFGLLKEPIWESPEESWTPSSRMSRWGGNQGGAAEEMPNWGPVLVGNWGTVLLENDLEVETFVKNFREKERLDEETEIVDYGRLCMTFGTRVRGARWRLCRRLLRDAWRSGRFWAGPKQSTWR